MGERCFMCRQEFSKLKGNFRVSFIPLEEYSLNHFFFCCLCSTAPLSELW